MTTPAAFFISDAHLGIATVGHDDRQERLVRFLSNLDPSADQLFIVGDLFDFWIEYGLFIRADFFPTLRALASLVDRGVQVHYIAGNHDFALGPFFRTQLGFSVYDRAFHGEVHGRTVHVQHGDGILAGDFWYRILRVLLRSRFNQAVYKLMHPAIGLKLATMASSTSRHFNAGPLSPRIVDKYRAAARRLLRPGTDTVVFGHTHAPELVEGEQGVYVNTGEWMREFSYAVVRDGAVQLWRHGPGDEPEEIQARPW